jgi:hypothetical protein
MMTYPDGLLSLKETGWKKKKLASAVVTYGLVDMLAAF